MTTAAPVSHKVLCGDCLEILKKFPSQSVDFVLTDPPYLVGYRDRSGRTVANDDNSLWVQPAFAEVARIMKPDSFCVSFYGWNHVEKFMAAWKTAGLRPVGHLVWAKRYASKVGFTQARHENAYLLAKGRPQVPNAPVADVLEWQYSGNRLHPTQKSVASLTPLIEAYTRRDDIILDPFAGSGTTAVAAAQLGRRPVVIEKEPEYCRTIQRRLQTLNAAG